MTSFLLLLHLKIITTTEMVIIISKSTAKPTMIPVTQPAPHPPEGTEEGDSSVVGEVMDPPGEGR